MKKKKSMSEIMVSVSAFAFAGMWAVPIFAQVVVNCSVGLSMGKNAQCSDTASLVINPNGSTSLSSGCLVATSPVRAGQCVIKTGGVPPTKNVRADFASTFVNIKNGAKQVRVDDFKMQYTATVPPASKFTFSPTDVSNTITLDIGGTVNVTADQGLGTYTGNITVRADPI